MRKKQKFPKHWLVRLYNAAGVEFNSFEIHDRFEWEASAEAELKAKTFPNCDDWNITKI